MTSAAEDCEAALYAALSAGVTLGSVYQHVPENTPPPVVIIGDLSSGAADTKGDDEDFEVEILTLIMDEQRKPLLALQAEVKTALHEKRIAANGRTFRPVQTSRAGQLLPDGETYYGSQTFLVLQAD